MKNIAIIGSGSWGVALAIHLAKKGNKIKIWSFAQEEADLINNEKKCKFLPGVDLPDNIECYLDYKTVIDGADMILHVTPSKFTRNTVRQYKEYVKPNQPIIICTKGFEEDTLLTLDEVVKEELPNNPIVALSGPSHAEEVSVGIPTAMVIATENEELANELQNVFMNENMRVYTSNDIRGVEIGGGLKNIIAFCAGIASGLNLGDNSYAALLTRGLAEINRLGMAMGGKTQTFYGLTGLGDLIVTCGSEHSRNRKAGKLVGQGMNINDVKKEVGMTIESLDNIDVAYKLSKNYNLDTPIISTVYDVLYNGLDANDAVLKLMTRTKKSESIL